MTVFKEQLGRYGIKHVTNITEVIEVTCLNSFFGSPHDIRPSLFGRQGFDIIIVKYLVVSAFGGNVTYHQSADMNSYFRI